MSPGFFLALSSEDVTCVIDIGVCSQVFFYPHRGFTLDWSRTDISDIRLGFSLKTVNSWCLVICKSRWGENASRKPIEYCKKKKKKEK